MRLNWSVSLVLIVISFIEANFNIQTHPEVFKNSVKKYCQGKLEQDFCSKANLAIMDILILQRAKLQLELAKIKQEREKINKLIEKNKKFNFLKDFFSRRLFKRYMK
jgi:hypothetical protein